jgi:rubrerythrin
MMATSEDFTRNARVGFYFGGAVCSLFGVLGLGRWILELVGLFDGIPDSDTQWKPNGIADADMRGSEEQVDGLLELRGVPGEDLLEIRHGDTDAAEEQDPDEARIDRDEEHEEFGLVFLSVMKVLEFLPAIMFLGLGIPLLVWLLWDTVLAPTVLLGLAGCVAIYLVVRRIRRYRSRSCPDCRMPMELLSEEDEDVHLSTSEVLEEKLKSASYDVWMCTSCSRTQTVRYGAFFSRYSKCPACGARTSSVSTSVISQPTNAMSGMKEITESCDNCDYKKQYRRSIPSTGS